MKKIFLISILVSVSLMLLSCGGSSDPALYTITGKVSNPDTGVLVGVTMELAGDQTRTASTDANGNYSFSVPNGEYRVTPTLGSTAFEPLDNVLEVKDAPVSGIDFLVVAPVTSPQVANTWRETGSMTYKRGMQAATLLADGRVLVVGGLGNNGGTRASTELYDPAKGKWTTTGYMSYKRQDHTATRLNGGMVLVSGGLSENSVVRASAELYDPATGKWTLTVPLNFARSFHTSTLLADGKVLVTGGENGWTATFLALASAELYDPATGKWTVTGSLNYKRRYHTATLLADGRILVAGGNDTSNTLASAEIYDPTTGQWSATGAMTDERQSHTATLLADGRVLVVGGWDANFLEVTGSAEIYDPGTGLWTTTNPLTYARSDHSATLLGNHKLLVTGGVGYALRASSELYDPVTGTWSTVGDLKYKRTRHTATLLNDGTVLAAGGTLVVTDAGPVRASAELFYPGN